ncbi:hypothetical protein DFH28DRAFT_1086163 [Melampsora americana]|nr:hypothetical protein DFH28DRAFT_1086163 [Melampsora americana]
MRHINHPISCLNCTAIGVDCTWGIVDSQLLKNRYQCDRCDQKEIHCEWTVSTPPPEIPTKPISNLYVKPPETETAAERILRIKSWVCKPEKPSDPKLRACWMAEVRIWNNGGNAPLPPQHNTTAPPRASTPPEPTCIKTPPVTTQPEFIRTPKFTPPPSPSPPEPSTTINDPPSPPAISVDFNYKPKFYSTVEDLIETPPHSPAPKTTNQDATNSINTENPFSENHNPTSSTSNLNDQSPTSAWPSITREGIDAFVAEYGPGCESVCPKDPTVALTETIFNMLSTHWKIFTSSNPVELNARSNLVKAFKNIVALDIVYRAHPRPELRPPHYDGITTGFPPFFPIPPTGHENFYDEVAKDNLNSSSEGKGKERAL